MTTGSKVVRGAVGVIVVVVLFIVVLNWWGDFRSSKGSAPAGEATSTATSASKGTSGSSKTAKSSSVVVMIDGLNFRVSPSADAKTIRGLAKGDKLRLVAKKGTWYQVKDAKGAVGWVTADSQYTRLVTP